MIRDADSLVMDALTGVPDSLFAAVQDHYYLRGVLEGHYNQTFRMYHNLDHIADLLAKLKRLDLSSTLTQETELAAAILYHDTVYSLRAKSPENEAASADVAIVTGMHAFKAGTIRWDVVHQIIMATTHDGKLTDRSTFEEKLIADLDLSTLAGSWEDYMKVNERVRGEYLTMYTEDEVDYGRGVFILKMLERPKLFYLDILNEADARANLEREYELLKEKIRARKGLS